tara:strand:- start:1632 stop:2186 length:555 start_codon:yes stop_codon:yes gene_type:complete
MSLEVLKAPSKSIHLDEWHEWLHACDYLNQRYVRRTGICPFSDTEMLFASFLSCAATLVGGVAFSELAISKKSSVKPGSLSWGRSDLYIDFAEKSYSFEIKRSKKMSNQSNLLNRFEAAKNDIRAVPDNEHDFAAAMMFGHVHIAGKEAQFDEFAQTKSVEFGYKFYAPECGTSYIFLSINGRA